ncbi:MAG: Gfo/Idh/MocA family oxidoreductase [Hyphomicrobiaceae bacterium]|nr:Gfo/Idh/MocA family oxidoreductase [Hyphomicrobiaceae bacterium]
MSYQKPLAIGFIGGGPGSFVGRHHFLAAQLDRRFSITCGVFAQTRARSDLTADELGIAASRRYESWHDMLAAEAALPDGIKAVGILTPNDQHFEMATAALELGFHVLCDKPVTRTLSEAEALAALVRRHSRIFAVSYNYSGYPMIRAARSLVGSGELGELRHVHARFPSGYLSERVELSGQKQAAWRTDPARVGASAALMDLGTHVHHLVRFVTGKDVTRLFVDLSSAFPGRRVDDNAEIIFRLEDGTPGSLWVSMIATGIDDEGPSISISGSKGSIDWKQQSCNVLKLRRPGEPPQILQKSAAYLGPGREIRSRIGFGPPDGFLEAFANLYDDFSEAIAGRMPDTLPTIEDGVAGLKFVEAGARSASEGRWIDLV